MATLDELLALLPDNDTGEIDAADMRFIVTDLYNRGLLNSESLDILIPMVSTGRLSAETLDARFAAAETTAAEVAAWLTDVNNVLRKQTDSLYGYARHVSDGGGGQSKGATAFSGVYASDTWPMRVDYAPTDSQTRFTELTVQSRSANQDPGKTVVLTLDGVDVATAVSTTAGLTFSNIALDFIGGVPRNIGLRSVTSPPWIFGLVGTTGSNSVYAGNPQVTVGPGVSTRVPLAIGFSLERLSAIPPTAGTWKRGDVVWDKAPREGNPIGWVCITAGAPGVWKPFGKVGDGRETRFYPATTASNMAATQNTAGWSLTMSAGANSRASWVDSLPAGNWDVFVIAQTAPAPGNFSLSVNAWTSPIPGTLDVVPDQMIVADAIPTTPSGSTMKMQAKLVPPTTPPYYITIPSGQMMTTLNVERSSDDANPGPLYVYGLLLVPVA